MAGSAGRGIGVWGSGAPASLGRGRELLHGVLARRWRAGFPVLGGAAPGDGLARRPGARPLRVLRAGEWCRWRRGARRGRELVHGVLLRRDRWGRGQELVHGVLARRGRAGFPGRGGEAPGGSVGGVRGRGRCGRFRRTSGAGGGGGLGRATNWCTGFCCPGVVAVGAGNWCMGFWSGGGVWAFRCRAARCRATALRGVRGRGRCCCFGRAVGTGGGGGLGRAANWCMGFCCAGVAWGACADWCMGFCRRCHRSGG